MYEIRNLAENNSIVFEGGKAGLIDFINDITKYRVDYSTPLYRLAYVLQPHYTLYKNNYRIYAI